MEKEKSIIKTIEARHSVRTYENRPLPKEMITKIIEYIDEVASPFDGKVRLQFIEQDKLQEKVKLGTYGVIKGSNYYIAAACIDGLDQEVMLGYILEKVVLFCTSLGLGTVWLGGTYNKSHFASVMDLQENETIKIVVPLGYEADKKSLVAKLMGNHNKQRKEFGTLFFDEQVENPLTKERAGKYSTALEMLRLAPSAVNKQPWRVIKQGEMFHFYAVNGKAFQGIDLGIALAHFYLTLMEQGIEGEFIRVSPAVSSPFVYITSWRTKEK